MGSSLAKLGDACPRARKKRGLLRFTGGAILALWIAGACSGSSSDPAEDDGAPGGGPCDSDKDCREAGELCDLERHVCSECLDATQCDGDADCILGACVPFTPCTDSRDCGADQVCDRDAGRCVQCLTDADCADGQLCQATICRDTCGSDKDCVDQGLLCDLDRGICVDCVLDTDCDDGYCASSICAPRVCVPGTASCVDDSIAACNERGDGFSAPLPCEDGCEAVGASAACVGGGGGEGGEGQGGASDGGAGSSGRGGTSGGGGDAGDAGGGTGGNGAMSGNGGGVSNPCGAGETTTLTGVVRDPAGLRPLYNVIVYVPSAPLAAIADGVSCDRCGAPLSGQPVSVALTDAQGRFELRDVPAGTDVPLVMQVGKWRREVAVPEVVACQPNAVTDPNLTRLPRDRSEGHLPKIAITTGEADAFECLLRRSGVADSEFTADSGSGRVHVYAGGDASQLGAGARSLRPELGGGVFARATTLWSNPTKLLGYDLLLMSCEGSQFIPEKRDFVANVAGYANLGGRILASHNQSYWFRIGFPTTASYVGVGVDLPQPIVGFVNTTFPKGRALADWLTALQATTVPGELALYQGQQSVTSVVAPTQTWLQVPVNPNDTMAGPAIQIMTFNTPVASASQCGRVALIDQHVATSTPAGGGDSSDPMVPFPIGCNAAPTTPQALAWEFLLFDLSSCIQPDTAAPAPPPLVSARE